MNTINCSLEVVGKYPKEPHPKNAYQDRIHGTRPQITNSFSTDSASRAAGQQVPPDDQDSGWRHHGIRGICQAQRRELHQRLSTRNLPQRQEAEARQGHQGVPSRFTSPYDIGLRGFISMQTWRSTWSSHTDGRQRTLHYFGLRFQNQTLSSGSRFVFLNHNYKGLTQVKNLQN